MKRHTRGRFMGTTGYSLKPTILSGTLISLFDTGPRCRPTPTPWTPAVAAATLAATTAACAAATWAADEFAVLLLPLFGCG
jgi:hypothetical protein